MITDDDNAATLSARIAADLRARERLDARTKLAAGDLIWAVMAAGDDELPEPVRVARQALLRTAE